MAIENTTTILTDSGLQPLVDLIQPLFLKVSVLVGGIFGLYLILILIRVYYERKKVKLLQDIRYDLDQLNIHNGLSYSLGKKGIITRFFNKITEKFRKARIKKHLNKFKKKK